MGHNRSVTAQKMARSSPTNIPGFGQLSVTLPFKNCAEFVASFFPVRSYIDQFLWIKCVTFLPRTGKESNYKASDIHYLRVYHWLYYDLESSSIPPLPTSLLRFYLPLCSGCTFQKKHYCCELQSRLSLKWISEAFRSSA